MTSVAKITVCSIEFIRQFIKENPTQEPRVIKATGGGAHKVGASEERICFGL
jgi:hypothetical protein